MIRRNQLTKRKREVAELRLQGKSNKQIALSLGIAESTVGFHLKKIYSKLQVSSRAEAILKLGRSTGLIAKISGNPQWKEKVRPVILAITQFREMISV